MPHTSSMLLRKESPHGEITVWQNSAQRWLCIDGVEQSRINLLEADRPALALYETILAFLLFVDMPEKVLLAGLGGGALARYLHSVDDTIKGDAVEINNDVARIAQQYFDFPSDNWNIHVMDVRQWQGSGYDLILVDIAQQKTTPVWLMQREMIGQFKKQLSANGVVVFNVLVDDAQVFSAMLSIVREQFNRRTVCITVPDHKNIVVFAFNAAPKYSIDTIRDRGMQLSARCSIGFDDLLLRAQKENPAGSGVF